MRRYHVDDMDEVIIEEFEENYYTDGTSLSDSDN
jgi:hypothetical protein